MLTQQKYRYFAEQCRSFATQTDVAERRETLLKMAETWDLLANKVADDEAERQKHESRTL